jgi:putative ABC transport system permease protein
VPENAWQTYQDSGKKALVEHGLMLQFGVQPGDTLYIGTQSFAIEGDLLSRPGRAGIGSAIAPVAFIPSGGSTPRVWCKKAAGSGTSIISKSR